VSAYKKSISLIKSGFSWNKIIYIVVFIVHAAEILITLGEGIMLNRTFITCILLLLISSSIFASSGTTGKLSGRIFDGVTGEPLPGVTITLEGTKMSALTDIDGYYFIHNIPAGTYSLTVTFMGYENIKVKKISIIPDHTTKNNFMMKETATEEMILLTAEKPLIRQDVTNTERIISSNEITNLPARGTDEIVKLQTGVVNYGYDNQLHMRGGRNGEIGYIVDGFETQSYFSGGSDFYVNNAALDQISLATGAFSAAYGRQMSGLVSVITKSGTQDYHGSLQAISDIFATAFNTNSYGYNVYDFSLSGGIPFTKNKTTFFISGERNWTADRQPRPNVDMLRDDIVNEFVSETNPAYGQPLSLTNNSEYYQDGRLPNNDLNAWHWQGKINYRLTDNVRVEGGFFGRKYRASTFWLRGRFDLTTHDVSFFRNNMAYLKVTHTISPRTFYTIGVNHSFENAWNYDNKHGFKLGEYTRHVHNPPDSLNLYYNARGDTHGLLSVNSIGESRFTYITYKGDITSQINRNHRIQAGFDYQKHTLRNINISALHKINRDQDQFSIQRITSYGFDFPRDENGEYIKPSILNGITDGVYWHWNPDDPLLTEDIKRWEQIDYGEKAPKQPVQYSFYLQDKMEYGNVVINAGLRYDYYDPDSPILPEYYEPIDPETQKLKTGDKQYSKKISPRLGIGFTVSEKTLLYMNYGKFYQMPSWNKIIIAYDTFEDRALSGNMVLRSNPELKPVTTISYEAGVTQQFGDFFRIDFTAYYKDVSGLLGRNRTQFM